MIAALQKSRTDAPVAAQRPPIAPEGAPEAGPGDVMVEKLASLEEKLDTILKLLGAEQKEDASSDDDATEATPNDDGY